MGEMRMFLFSTSAVLLLLSCTLLLVDAAAFDAYDKGPCLQSCCCRVCSSRQAPAWPYGVLNQPVSTNPVNPFVVGAACRVPVWSDRGQMNSTSGSPVNPPSTLLWTNFAVFGDLESYAAPTSCTCCRLSVDTSCSEEIPAATPPKTFRYINGSSVSNTSSAVELVQGVQLSTGDIIELRNNTWCGYSDGGGYIRRSSGSTDMNVASDMFSVRWNIASLPPTGCYRMCYYHANLTTPGWYFIGDVVINGPPPGALTYTMDPRDRPLPGNEVVITFNGLDLLSVFDDVAEIRSSGMCGDPGPELTTTLPTLHGLLNVMPDTVWCLPALARRYTTIRPVQEIVPVYADCPLSNRIYVDKVQWRLTLPTDGVYTVCYRHNGVWNTLAGALVVPMLNTAADALNALYASTNGANWRYRENWGGPDPCVYYGVECNVAGDVVGVYLSNNNLAGPIPATFFQAVYFTTLIDLKLDNNALTGTIPREIGLLRKLKHLDVGFNPTLTGTVPLTLLRTSLITLYVSNTGMSGDMPHDLTLLHLRWFNMTGLFAEPAPIVLPPCPVHDLICSDKGSTDVGVRQCGYTGITEEECLVQGCCWNLQAPLIFGGVACFTKKPRLAAEFPQCQAQSCNKLPAPIF